MASPLPSQHHNQLSSIMGRLLRNDCFSSSCKKGRIVWSHHRQLHQTAQLPVTTWFSGSPNFSLVSLQFPHRVFGLKLILCVWIRCYNHQHFPDTCVSYHVLMVLQHVRHFVPATLNRLWGLCLASGVLGFVSRCLLVRWVDDCTMSMIICYGFHILIYLWSPNYQKSCRSRY